jgi:hypothetical protein
MIIGNINMMKPDYKAPCIQVSDMDVEDLLCASADHEGYTILSYSRSSSSINGFEDEEVF